MSQERQAMAASIPAACRLHHPWRPGTVMLSWESCDCAAAQAARGGHGSGWRAVLPAARKCGGPHGTGLSASSGTTGRVIADPRHRSPAAGRGFGSRVRSKLADLMPVSISPQQRNAIVARLRAAGCVFAEDEAGLLIAAADSYAALQAMADRRASGLPLEQVVGWAEFCGLRISSSRPASLFLAAAKANSSSGQAIARAGPAGFYRGARSVLRFGRHRRWRSPPH